VSEGIVQDLQDSSSATNVPDSEIDFPQPRNAAKTRSVQKQKVLLQSLTEALFHSLIEQASQNRGVGIKLTRLVRQQSAAASADDARQRTRSSFTLTSRFPAPLPNSVVVSAWNLL